MKRILGILLMFAAPVMALDRPVVLASAAGAHLDSHLRTGGGSDDTAVLQRILDQAKSGRPVHLIVDGPALITGLDVYGSTLIECLPGAGFFLKDNSDRSMIRNAHRSRDRISDRNIRIEGCFFNGNREGQVRKAGPFKVQDSDLTHYNHRQESDGTFKSMLQFFGVENVSLERVTLHNGRAFGAWFANAQRIRIRDIEVDANFPAFPSNVSAAQAAEFLVKFRTNGDGLHFNGPIQYLTIDGARFRTDDDGIGLNANDMGVDDMTVMNDMGPYVGQGPIRDVSIRNVTLMDSLVGLRLLSSNQPIDRVLIEHLSGMVRHRGIVISRWANPLNSPHLGDVGSVAFDHVNLAPAPFYNWRALYPSLYASPQPGNWDVDEEGEVPVFSINAPVKSLSLSNIYIQARDARPIIRLGRDARVDLFSADLRIDDAVGNSIPVRVVGGEIRRLRLDLDWMRGPGNTSKTPIELLGGRIDEIVGRNGSDRLTLTEVSR